MTLHNPVLCPLHSVLAPIMEPQLSPCAKFECGVNAICRERDNIAICQCTSNYIGNPYLACRPECVINPDCQSNLMCLRNKCINPCAGVCGRNAECSVVNHQPMCTCLPGYTGNPFATCSITRKCHYLKIILLNKELLSDKSCDCLINTQCVLKLKQGMFMS